MQNGENPSTNMMQGQGSQANQQNTNQVQPQKTPMFQFNYEINNWQMNQYFRMLFENQNNILNLMYETINEKWSEQELNAYTYYLNSYRQCIFMASSMNVQYYEDFLAWIQYYSGENPLGAELYQKQLVYLQYLQKKEEKKNRPKESKHQQNQKQEEKKVVVQKQKIIVRKEDPEINLQKLMSTDWDPTKYINISTFAKENANIVFIGHVDSGKSTLTGNIIKELKEIDEQELARNKAQVKQNKMEAWEDASVSDIIPEERIDGKTRQYAKMNFTLKNKRFTLFDAPGHKNYVPNMIMGACQADIAVLIISSKEGEFQSGFQKDGQTKEHAMLAKALGVIELIAVVTKMGTNNWSQKRFNYIKQQVQPFLDTSCGFHKVTFIPIESVLHENQNIHTRIQDSWYKGPCFLEYLDNVSLPQRKPLGPLRIPVIDKFKDQGNLYAYGKVESGTIIEDQVVTILPQRIQMGIREIYNAKDERMPFAIAGENVKIRTRYVDENDFNRGNMICNNLNYCQESAELKANITILELPQEKKLVSSGYQCIIHMHAIAAEVQISKVEAKIDKNTNKKVAATFLRPGEKGIAQVKIDRPICLEKYDFMNSLGRFTLRDEGKTIGYGEIIGIKPAKTMFQEQKEQLGGTTDKRESAASTNEGKKVEQVTKQVQKMTLESKKE